MEDKPAECDLMAPDTEPTDEELASVMQEVAVVARQQTVRAAEFGRDQLARALAAVAAGRAR